MSASKRVSIDFPAGKRLGYRHNVATLQAATRALRWLQSYSHKGETMPTHIAEKAKLLKIEEMDRGTKV